MSLGTQFSSWERHSFIPQGSQDRKPRSAVSLFELIFHFHLPSSSESEHIPLKDHLSIYTLICSHPQTHTHRHAGTPRRALVSALKDCELGLWGLLGPEVMCESLQHTLITDLSHKHLSYSFCLHLQNTEDEMKAIQTKAEDTGYGGSGLRQEVLGKGSNNPGRRVMLRDKSVAAVAVGCFFLTQHWLLPPPEAT